MRVFRSLFLMAALAAVTSLSARPTKGQVSPLYLRAHANNPGGTVYVVQNGQLIDHWSSVDNGGPLYVLGDKVRTAGNAGESGREFLLDGTPTGVHYPAPQSHGHMDDVTTDGRHIYGWAWSTQNLVRMDLDWSNPSTMFSYPDSLREFVAVAYDPTDQTFWLSGWSQASMRQVDVLGNTLNSFPIAVSNGIALALDPADDTLWFNHYGTNSLYQYTKSGALLQSISVSGLGSDLSGGEFRFVPEPATLMGIVVLLPIVLRRRIGE